MADEYSREAYTSIFFFCSFSLITIFLSLQYGPIAHIDLKIPPRPPGYAFVEVSFGNVLSTFFSFVIGFQLSFNFFFTV